MSKFPAAAVAAILCAGLAIYCAPASRADDARPQPAAAKPSGDQKGDLKGELEALQNKADQEVQAGKKTEADYADVLKQCDDLLAKYKGGDPEDLSSVLELKIELYSQVLNQDDKAIELLKQARADYPDTVLGMRSGRLINEITRDAEDKKIQAALVPGAVFPDFDEKDLDGKSISVGNYKGKIVLVDFWATWCEPCMGEMPNVFKVYQKYHDKGFEIIGVSLDEDRDSLLAVLKQNNIPWPQFYDGQRFKNKLAAKYGIDGIPMNYLIGKDGKIVDSNLRGDDLDAAVAKALGQ